MSLFARIAENAKAAARDEAATIARESQDPFRLYSDRTAPTPGWQVPVPPVGTELHPYQAAAVEAILAKRRAILGHAPGLGKTLMALAPIAFDVQRGGRALVICPPTLRFNWAAEIARFYPQLSVTVVEGQKPATVEPADVTIVGDSVVAYRHDDLLAIQPTTLVVDEAQRHKSLGDWAKAAKRANAVRSISDQLHSDAIVITLSGTLVVNRTNEVYGPVRITGERIAKAVSGGASKTAFWDRWVIAERNWFNGREVRQAVGCVDPVALHERLRETCYIRVEREDVIADLPSKTWNLQRLALNGELKNYNRIERDFIRWVAEQKGDADARRAAKAEAITKLMTLWKEAGVASVKAAVEYVAQLVEQDEQVVVMAHHREVVDALTAGLGETTTVVQIVGGQSDQAKADAVAAFRSGQARVLVGNITAAGTGLNLEVSANLVFVQLPWSSGDLIQASDRIYRVTQKRNCTIHVLLAMGTVAERLWSVVEAKTVLADAVNAGIESNITGENVHEAVLSSFGW